MSGMFSDLVNDVHEQAIFISINGAKAMGAELLTEAGIQEDDIASLMKDVLSETEIDQIRDKLYEKYPDQEGQIYIATNHIKSAPFLEEERSKRSLKNLES